MPLPGTTAERGAVTSDADIAISTSQQPYVTQSEEEKKIAEKICRRQQRMEDERALVDSAWDLIDDIGCSRRSVWDLGQTRGRLVGEKTGEKIYDGTMMSAGQDLADGLQGQTAINGLVWWAAHFRDKMAQKDYIARQWIDDVQDGALTEMAQSNMYEQFNEAYLDAVFMGTATVDKPIWLPALGRLHYQTRHPREIFIARNDYGIVNLRHRKFPMSNRNIMEKFGVEKFDLALRQKMEQSPFSRRMVIHAMYLNTERDTRKWTAQNKRIASVYVLENEKLVLSRSGFDDWPQVNWCWRLNSQETYGRGPAMDTVFESATLNSACHYLLDAAQLSIQRPLIADEALKGKLKIGPYGVTWVTGNEGATVRELFRGNPDYPIAMDQIMKMRDELRDKFKAKTFMLLTTLTEMTERMNMMQIAEIKGEKAALLGPVVGRNQYELLCPIINATVSVLLKNGRLPPPPRSLASYAHTPVDLEFLGPIATALKRYVQTQGLTPFITRLIGQQPLLAVWPEMKDKIKADELFDVFFEADGAPSKIEQDPKVLLQLRKAKLQMMAQQAKIQQAGATGAAHKDLSKAPEPGAPTDVGAGQ